MKKLVLFLLFGYLFPCIISFSPTKIEGKVGEIKTFKVEIKNIHTPCLLEIDETFFDYQNVKLISVSKWDTIKRNLFQKVISIQLLKEGKGSVKIKRTCLIQTSEGKIEIIIKKREYKELKEEVNNLLKKIILGEEISLSYLINTFDEFIKEYEKLKKKEDKNLYLLIKDILNYLLKIKELSKKKIE